MRYQTIVNQTRVMDRIRGLGNKLQVVAGPGFETDLARQLDMPEYSAAELAEAVEQLVTEGKLHTSTAPLDLGKGGISKEPVIEEVIIFWVD